MAWSGNRPRPLVRPVILSGVSPRAVSMRTRLFTPARSQLLQNLEAIHARKLHIEHDQIVIPIARLDESDLPVVHHLRIVPVVLECPRQMGSQLDFVFDDKNSHSSE